MDYNGLKRILYEIQKFKQREGPSTPMRNSQQRLSLYRPLSGLDVRNSFQETTGDVEDQVIVVETMKEDDSREVYNTNFLESPKGGESEKTFFEKLDEELNKVNTFYRDKVEEVIEEATSLNKQMNALIALRIKVEQPYLNKCHIQRNVSMDSSSTGSSNVNSSSGVKWLGGRHLAEEHQIEMISSNQLIDSSAYPSENGHLGSKIDIDRIDSHGQGGSSSPPSIHDSISSGAFRRNRENSDDPRNVLERVRINNTLEDPMSTIRSVLNDSRDKDLQFKKEELKEAEGRLKVVFIEFHRKLHLLKHYK